MARPGLIRSLRRALRGPDRREPGDVNHIALGNHCHMAHVLKQTGLRTWSGPFDWIFSSPAMVRHCLADDFATLLDPEQYRSTPPDERPAPDSCLCSHRFYAAQFGIVSVFNHHDPGSVAADARFLHEGVRRFRSALGRAGADNRFYLLASRPTPDDTIPALAEELGRHGANNRLYVLQTRRGAVDAPVERVFAPQANLTWLRVPLRTESTGVRFGDPADDARLRGVVLDLAATA